MSTDSCRSVCARAVVIVTSGSIVKTAMFRAVLNTGSRVGPRVFDLVFTTSAHEACLVPRVGRHTRGYQDLRLHDLRHEADSRFIEAGCLFTNQKELLQRERSTEVS